MSKKKKSVVSRLFFTSGTIFLVSVIAICTINFARDGRAFETPLLSAAAGITGNRDTTGTAKKTEDYKTIKYNKPSSKTSSKSSSNTASKSPSTGKTPAASGTGTQHTNTADP